MSYYNRTDDFDKMKCMFDFFKRSEIFKFERDLGDIFHISSDGKDLKFFDMVKARKTGKFYNGKEIIILNVTPYTYTNFEGQCKASFMGKLNAIFDNMWLGYDLPEPKTSKPWEEMFSRKTIKHRWGKHEYIETYSEYIQRAQFSYNAEIEMCKGIFNDYNFFFVGDDPYLNKPLSLTGYCYYFSFCLSYLTRRYQYRFDDSFFESVFGNNREEIGVRYQDYINTASILGISDLTIPTKYISLDGIRTNVHTKAYIYFETAKYFFGNGKMFSEKDHNMIKKFPIYIRNAYSALGGNYCLKTGEEGDIIAYFTALNCTQSELPLLLSTTNKDAQKVLSRRFGITTIEDEEREVA